MMNKKTTKNPLALAVMGQLFERPMHPYEVASTMKERGKHETIKLKYGSLYTVVESLERDGLIRARETVREGRRPERTIYELTDAGREAYLDWLRRLLREPVKEYTQFGAGLTYIASVSPSEAVELLRERTGHLEREIEEMRSRFDEVRESGLPRVFLIEGEHGLMLREAELRWVREIADEIEAGTLGGVEFWKNFHSEKEGGM